MKWRLLSSGQSVNRFFSYLEKEIRKWLMIRRKLLRQPYLQNSSSHRRKCYRVCVHARHGGHEKRSRTENQRLHGKRRMKKAKNDCAAWRNCSGRRQNLSSGAFRSEIPFGSGLGQTEKSQNSPSGKVLKTQKNPAKIERFQPDLVGVSGFEPEASWSRRLVGYFSWTFRGISAHFRSGNFTVVSFPARINPPDFSAFGSRFGSGQKTSGAETAPL